MHKPKTHLIQRMEKHVERFIRDYKLFDKSEPLYICVSGGVDSMVLLSIILKLKNYGYSNELHVLHVNHGTRPGQTEDEKLVREFCASYKIDFSVRELTDLPKSNFEMQAREQRYEFFYEKAHGHKLLLAHHIDDSLEWSFMQQFKTASLKGSLGIPVVNGQLRRPLMAASRLQIERYAALAKVPFRDDPSNQNTTHERNGIRKWLTGIRFRYPTILENYVQRQTALAHRLGLHHLNPEAKYNLYRAPGLVHILNTGPQHDYIQLKEILRQQIPLLSGKARGRIRAQLEKAEQMVSNNKIGPLTFSGGVELYNFSGHLLLKSVDVKIATPELAHFASEQEFSYTNFEKVWMAPLTEKTLIPFYPVWVIVPAGQWLQCPRINFPPAQKLIDYCEAHGLQLISSKHLSIQWSKRGNYKRPLRLQLPTRLA